MKNSTRELPLLPHDDGPVLPHFLCLVGYIMLIVVGGIASHTFLAPMVRSAEVASLPSPPRSSPASCDDSLEQPFERGEEAK